MAEKHEISIEEIDTQIIRSCLAEGEDLQRENYPHLGNISARFIYQLMPRPTFPKAPEYVYVKLPASQELGDDATLRLELLIARWNMCWEAGHLRHDMFADDLPPELQWLEHLDEQNVYLIPQVAFHHYYAYTPLYHLLPRQTLEYFGLPLLKKGLWPQIHFAWAYERIFPKGLDNRLASAFASHIWPLLNPGSPRSAFSTSEPLHLLAHNLDFWLPYLEEQGVHG